MALAGKVGDRSRPITGPMARAAGAWRGDGGTPPAPSGPSSLLHAGCQPVACACG